MSHFIEMEMYTTHEIFDGEKMSRKFHMLENLHIWKDHIS